MNFMLTLEHLALAKIAICLWSQDDVKDCTNKSLYSLKKNWRDIVEVVIEKSSKVPLPEILKKRLSCFTVPVGLQLLSWLDVHDNQYGLVRVLPVTLIWTSLGTIDNKRTAEILVKDENLGIHERFKLACIYCLEDDIRGLWNTFGLRESGYTNLLRDQNYQNSTSLKNYLHLLSFWAHYVENSLDEWQRNVTDINWLWTYHKLTPCKCAFQISAELGNVVASRYFLQKLNPKYEADIGEESSRKVASLLKSRKHEYDEYLSFFRNISSSVVIFILSTSNAQQQSEILNRHTYHVLKSLIDWPWYNLFLETANNNWAFLSESECRDLLYHIVYRMSYKLEYTSELFKKVWQQSLKTYKQHFTERDDFGILILNLCRKEDERNIQLILKDSSISARKKIVHGLKGQLLFQFLVSCKNRNLAQYLMKNIYDEI